MKVTYLPDAEPRPRRIAVGTFDGVHLGHREVIRGADTVLTFEPHPRAVVAPHAAPKLLTTLAAKADLVESLGVEELVVIPFDGAFSQRSAQEFIGQVLIDQLGAAEVSVGENFHFGHKARGNPALLAAQDAFTTRVVGLVEVDGERMAQTAQDFIDHELVERLGARSVSVGENFRFGNRARGDAALLEQQEGFVTRVSRLVEVDGEIISSTHIRGLVAAGDVAAAARFLGAPFHMRGTVAHGDKRGRTLGFPTANLVPDPKLVVPDHGIYACRAHVDGETHIAATNVGVRPTFTTGRGLLVEAFLLDFEGDIYDHELRLDFLARLRGERRFDSVEALVEQMDQDVVETRRIVT